MAILEPGKPPVKVVADEDLVAQYKGSYQDLQKEADEKAFTKADAAHTKGLVLGGIGSVLAILAALFGKGLMDKLFKKTT